MTYWDSATLVKVYFSEPDSQTFRDFLVRSGKVRTSELARLELLSALSRKERSGDLVVGGADALFQRFLLDASAGAITALPVGTDVLQEATRLIRTAHAATPPVMIRTLDVLHVATAVASGCTTLVATDARMRAVATLAGLQLFP